MLLASAPPLAPQDLFLAKRFEVRRTVDVQYGSGTVNLTTSPMERDLLLDLYEPTGASVPPLKPGLVLVHGGAWRYGSKESDRFENPSRPGDFSSPVSDYATEFARRGYVCAVIDYRKIQDDPAVRGTLSTPPIDISGLAQAIRSTFAPEFPLDQVRRGIEAGFDDTVVAIGWLADRAETLGIDPTRIALGGWSAGAVNSLWAAYVDGPGLAPRRVQSPARGLGDRHRFR